LTKIASAGFGVYDEETNEKSVYQHAISGQKFLILVIEKQDIVAFAAFAENVPFQLLFLTGIVVNPQCQHHGIGKEVFRIAKEELRPKFGYRFFACTTQNPIMRVLFEETCQAVFPSRNGVKSFVEVDKIALALMTKRRGVFNPATFVSEGLYSTFLYPQIPESRNMAINKFFSEKLSIQKGQSLNGMLLVGVF